MFIIMHWVKFVKHYEGTFQQIANETSCCYNILDRWGCSSAGRAPPLHGGSQGFESPQLHQRGINRQNSYLFIRLYPWYCTIKHLKSRIELSCPNCGARLGATHTYYPKCGRKVEKALTQQQEQRRQRVLYLLIVTP